MINYKVVARRNGFVTVVTSDGRTVTISVGGNGK